MLPIPLRAAVLQHAKGCQSWNLSQPAGSLALSAPHKTARLTTKCNQMLQDQSGLLSASSPAQNAQVPQFDRAADGLTSQLLVVGNLT